MTRKRQLMTKRTEVADSPLDCVVHEDGDLRIFKSTPEQVARVLMLGGVKPHPETKRSKGTAD